MERVRIRERLLVVIGRVAGVDPVDISDEMKLGGTELGLGVAIGQVEFLELQTGIEQEFNIRIRKQDVPDPAKAKKLTVAEVIDFLETQQIPESELVPV